MSNIIKDMIVNYTGVNRTAERTWDYIQKSVRCCYVVPVLMQQVQKSAVSQLNCKNERFCDSLPQDDRSPTDLKTSIFL